MVVSKKDLVTGILKRSHELREPDFVYVTTNLRKTMRYILVVVK